MEAEGDLNQTHQYSSNNLLSQANAQQQSYSSQQKKNSYKKQATFQNILTQNLRNSKGIAAAGTNDNIQTSFLKQGQAGAGAFDMVGGESTEASIQMIYRH